MVELKNVSFFYEASEKAALSNINLHIKQGQVVVLCGKSGCGKTSIIKLINGLIPGFWKGNLTGDILINNESIIGKNVQEISKKVGSVFQNPRSQFFNVDTTGEVVFGCENKALQKQEIQNRLEETTKLFDIENLLDKSIFDMSGGEKQKIACASVAATNPEIFVLDEPTSNLDLSSIRELEKIISIWKSEGKTIVVAEHRLNYLKDIADRFVYIDEGKILWDKSREDFLKYSDDELHELGLRSIGELKAVKKNLSCSCEWLTLKNFDFKYQNGNGINIDKLQIPLGQIIGIVGENGAGKSTFVRALSGVQKHKGIGEKNSRVFTSRDLLKKSYLVMQDVNHQLFTESVAEEIKISVPKEEKSKENEIVEKLLAEMDLKQLETLHPMSLSGGQKQRVAVASAFASEKELLFFDEPTSGLDYNHMKEFAENLQQIKKLGKTPVIVTHDMELLAQCCDYILLFSDGKIKEEGWCSNEKLENITNFLTYKNKEKIKKEMEILEKKSPIATVWELGKSGHKKIIASIIMAIAGVIFGIVPFISASNVVSELLSGSKHMDIYIKWILTGVAAYALNTFLYAEALGVSHKATFVILKELREKVMAKLPKLPLGTIMDMKSGKIKQIVVDQIDSMETTLAHVFPELTANFGGFLIIAVYMFVVDWRMGLLSLVSIPVGFALMSASMKGYGKKYAQSVEITSNMNEGIIEYIGGIEVIRAYSLSDKSCASLADKCRADASFFYNWMKSCKTNIYAMIIAPATLLTILPFGWIFYSNGSLSIGDFVTEIILSLCLAGPLLAAIDFVDTLAKLGTVVSNVESILNAKEQNHIVSDEKVKCGNEIELKNVVFSYSEKNEEVLKKVSLKIKEGTKTALVGPSGSGKSTIAKLIAGFWDIDEGSISFGGVDTKNIPLNQLYEKIAYVAQDNFLFDDTVMENIRMGKLDATDEEVIACAKASGCHEFIQKLEKGYETNVGSGGTHLSGGERQRIAIARAMLKNAPIVILDEATAYIDPENENLIQNAVGKLVKGKTLIVIAHRLSTITDSDQIILVKDGKAEISGTHEELLKNSELYRSMWEAHIGAKDGDVC